MDHTNPNPDSRGEVAKRRVYKQPGKSINMSGAGNHRWKGGRSRCLDCHILLSDRRSKRCSNHKIIVMSADARLRLSVARMGSGNPMYGRKLSQDRKDLISYINSDRRGAKNPNWKGTTPLNKAIREMPESRKLKIQVFIRDGRKCQVPDCGSGDGIQAHHIKSVSELIYQLRIRKISEINDHKSKLFNLENLITLCRECHKKTKNYGNSSFNYPVDNRGFIKDIIVNKNINSVVEVSFEKGAVRGNHFHPMSLQVDLVIDGLLLVRSGNKEFIVGSGESVISPKGSPHAYRAIKDSRIMSFVDGPRQGFEYESDTIKLNNPIL